MFKGKVVLVTGGTKGIGKHIAMHFASQQAIVVLCSRTDDDAKRVSEEISKTYQVEGLGKGVDVSSFDDVQAFIKDIISTFGRLDILVNNAGITADNLLLRMSFEEWQKVININLGSVFNCTKAAIRPMMKQKYGRIINMSSVIGITGNPGQSNYAASKSGIIGFTKSIAREYGAKGVTCNAVAPGFVETDMTDTLPKEYINNIIDSLSVKRIAKPDEIASLVSYLASDAASYITGQTIAIDGGLTM